MSKYFDSGTFAVWCPDQGQPEEEADHLEATSAEWVAGAWAEEHDSEGDFPFMSAGEKGRKLTVHVRDPDGTVTRWGVAGEMVPTYSAEALP